MRTSIAEWKNYTLESRPSDDDPTIIVYTIFKPINVFVNSGTNFDEMIAAFKKLLDEDFPNEQPSKKLKW